MDLRVKDAKSYENYCKGEGKKPIVRKQFVAAMKAKGHVTEDVRKMGGGVAYYDIEFIDASDSSSSSDSSDSSSDSDKDPDYY